MVFILQNAIKSGLLSRLAEISGEYRRAGRVSFTTILKNKANLRRPKWAQSLLQERIMKINHAPDSGKTKPNKVNQNQVRNNAALRKCLIFQDRPDILYENEAQQRLNDAQMDAGLQKTGGVRMPQRVAGYVLAYITLPEGCLQAALHAVGSDGRGALLGGEKPVQIPCLRTHRQGTLEGA